MSGRSVSIVSVNYNGLEHTSRMIESLVLYETYPFEIIVIDNGSVENEADSISKLHPHVKTIRSDRNLGFAGGNNLGVAAASGDYIFFLNNDTLIRGPILGALVDAFERWPDAGAISPKILFEYSDRVVQYAGFSDLSGVTLRNSAIGYGCADGGQFDTAGQTSFAHGAAMMVPRAVVESVGMMPECYFLYYEELDWCEMMRRSGYRIFYEPAAEVFHKESMATGAISGLKSYYQVRNRLFYARRNRMWPQKQLSVGYQLLVATPKLLLTTLLKRQFSVATKILKGAVQGVVGRCAMLLMAILLGGCGGGLNHDDMRDQVRDYAQSIEGLGELPQDVVGDYEIEVTIAGVEIPADSVVIPKLKYNKKFAYTFTGDDTYASIYRKALMISLGRDILKLDKEAYDGVDAAPNQMMAYSDPFGRMHFFKFGISAQVFHKFGVVTPYFSRFNAFSREYITWDELDIFQDFGCGVYNHGGGLLTESMGLNTFTFGVSQNVFEKHLGNRPKFMIRPDGDDRYIDVAQNMSDFVMCTTEGTANNFYPELINLKGADVDLRSAVQMRTCMDGVVIEDMIRRIDSLARMSNHDAGYWIHDFVHSISNDRLQSVSTSLVIAYLTYINNRYGIRGADNIWFASMDEVYEYWALRNDAKVSVTHKNGGTVIKIRGVMPEDFLWKEMSFKILSDSINMPSEGAITVKGGVYHLVKASESGVDLFVDMSERSVMRAVKHIMLLDRNYTNYNLQNANFFVDDTPEKWRKVLRAKLNDIVKTKEQQNKK